MLLLLAILPPLFNLGRYQRRIAGAISRSIQRPVSMDSVSLRLLPWPAFKLENFAVGEAPGFGAEPALRAPEVIAEPRLSSLWRGRFELARVELTDASVNLVRDPDGRWNISSVLLQASHVSNAPTAQAHPGPAPRFPYIEATGTRINLKRGAEKLPYSLLDADFSMSLASPEMWHIKLEGQPVRTDLDLFANDTGLLRVEGDIHRASALGTMPLKLDAAWTHASLGQLERILLGSDAGWRGDIDATARLAGEIDHLGIRTHFVIANLHRQEFTPERAFTVDATCRGLYSRATPAADAFRCRWPLGAGGLLLTGSTAAPQGQRVLQLAVDRVPADVLASAVGLLRQDAPAPGLFSGELSGGYTYVPVEHRWSGEARMPRLSIAGAGLDGAPLVLAGLEVAPSSQDAFSLTANPLDLRVPAQPLTVSAQLSPTAWSLEANGAGALPNLQAAAAAFQLPGLGHFSPMPAPAGGPAQVLLALTRSGTWLGPERTVSGTARLSNIRWQATWLPFPVDLMQARAALSPGLVRWNLASANAGPPEHPIHLEGSVEAPLDCEGQVQCTAQIALSTPTLNAGALQAALTGGRPELLQELLSRFNASRMRLPAFAGTVHTGELMLGKLPVQDASAVLVSGEGAGSAIEFKSLDGRALGGTLHLGGTLSLAGGTPAYRLRGSFEGISAEEAAALWNENWSAGTLGGDFVLRMHGGTAEELLASTKGTLQASWLHGAPAPPVFRFASWDGTGTIAGTGLQIDRSAFSGTPATVTGTIGWDRSLNLQLLPEPGAQPTAITGTLAHPQVQPPPE